jgi:hypothetical protein
LFGATKRLSENKDSMFNFLEQFFQSFSNKAGQFAKNNAEVALSFPFFLLQRSLRAALPQ